MSRRGSWGRFPLSSWRFSGYGGLGWPLWNAEESLLGGHGTAPDDGAARSARELEQAESLKFYDQEERIAAENHSLAEALALEQDH